MISPRISESRTVKSLLNARTNLLFYVLVLLATFFSRRVFLEKLGADFVGMTSTLSSLLGLLNLAELGVGSAIGYMLYKPLLRNDREQIGEIVSILGYIYRKIGWIVVLAAIVLSLFLLQILAAAPFSGSLIYFAYGSYLFSAVLGYFINYRQLLLSADQRQYVVTAYYQGANILRLLIQTVLLYRTANPYYWVISEMIFAVIYSLILNQRIDRTYPWLRTNVRRGKEWMKVYPELMKYTKQIFVHRIGATALFQISPLIVYAYTSLAVVACYTNYVLILAKVQQFVLQLLGSADAGIGQLVAEGDRVKIQQAFDEILSLRYWVSGVLTGTLWFVLNPFITLWVGTAYALPNYTVVLLLINLFIMLTRVADSFNAAYGLFYDTWAPLTEAGLNVGISVLFGEIWGLNGILSGTTFSLLAVVVIWKPYFLFSKGFHLSVWDYWKKTAGHIIVVAGIFALFFLLNRWINFQPASHGWGGWLIYALLTTGVLGTALWGTLFACTRGMRMLTRRLMRLAQQKMLWRGEYT